MAIAQTKDATELTVVLLYVPCPDIETARLIAKTCLTEKLIGCANIVPNIESHYIWDDDLESNSEILMILKTLNNKDLIDRLSARIKQLHPYEVPCIMTLEPSDINTEYKDWLKSNISL